MFSSEYDVMVRKEQLADQMRAQAHDRLVREVERELKKARSETSKIMSLTTIARSVLSVLHISRASRPLPLQ
ncbi:MAG: hypothetical protein U0822_10445 [Anaerolineae bacterium]